MRILLVEDETRMAEALSELLRLEKNDVQVCTDGLSGLEAACTREFDLLILDVLLPGVSGFEIARSFRKMGKKTPILMLTAKSEVDDKVSGLDSGADDYLTKPFEVKELLARLRALGRRSANAQASTLSFGDIVLNTETFQICSTTNGQSVRLSKKEFRIMELLLANQRQVLTREQLAIGIWGYENEAEYNNVEVYISFTRKKLAFIDSSVEIKALRGIGYELRDGNV
ncbi:MAG: response regulator transcription factor [Clostridiales bacterium]|nr:response regulator transcription factor [Clostridiales bacterium]